MVTGRAVWRRVLRGATYTVMVFPHPDGTVFELFTAGAGRVSSLGRFASRADALRAALDGR
ncbi:hypothetical protein [Mycobacterium avium]|uniref:hypothetical protein n=1 Tax=Mycobacterium avium TaxID=1764 RepID=UPI001158CC7D|nr:hypothetical protein [Mycobacterium avium]